MAIYSVELGRVGRTTHRAGTAGAHARYIAQRSNASIVMAEHMPTAPRAAQRWLDAQEASDRKNARVIEKIRVALPVELDTGRHQQLIRRYTARITQGRAPWLAAIHDKGETAHNPHAHIVIRDRDIVTGKRVANLSSKGSCERLRELWSEEVNRALAEAGEAARVDHRSLKAQGIDRVPTCHMGPAATHMERRGLRTERGERNRKIEAMNAEQQDRAATEDTAHTSPDKRQASPFLGAAKLHRRAINRQRRRQAKAKALMQAAAARRLRRTEQAPRTPAPTITRPSLSLPEP